VNFAGFDDLSDDRFGETIDGSNCEVPHALLLQEIDVELVGLCQMSSGVGGRSRRNHERKNLSSLRRYESQIGANVVNRV
jgi:O-acetyl-ADP-ribose deacetylase (regulator of RNase III)